MFRSSTTVAGKVVGVEMDVINIARKKPRFFAEMEAMPKLQRENTNLDLSDMSITVNWQLPLIIFHVGNVNYSHFFFLFYS